MKFTQEGVSAGQIIKSLRALIKEGGFNADALIIDGYNFSESLDDDISAIKAFAAEMGVAVWYSCNVKGEQPYYDQNNIPSSIKEYADLFEVIIILEPKQDYIALKVSRNVNSGNLARPALKLDPKTLLLLEKTF